MSAVAHMSWRRRAKERLEHNLKNLSSYCQPGVFPQELAASDGWAAGLLRGVFGSEKFGCWPMRGLLREIQEDVLVFALHERKKPIFPFWKAFEQVDRRMPKLRLKSRINDLIHRARSMLRSESELTKAMRAAMARNASAVAQSAWRDMVLEPKNLVKPLQEDRRIVWHWCMAEPLVCWAIEIAHPMAKHLHDIVEFFPTVKEMNAERRREINRERQRQFRFSQKTGEKNPSKSVTAT
jgi:hypothetical protein